jgi:hypothetical protein
MSNRSFLVPLAAGLLLTGFSTGASLGAGTDAIEADLDRLHGALVPTDPAGLVNFLQVRTQREPSQEKLSRLIEALHAKTPAARQQSCAELVAIGKPALPLLRAVVPSNADAVPALISLVAELPVEQSVQAEDYLSQLAGEAGPQNLPENEEDRKGRSEAWSAWWQTHKGKVVLADPAHERFAPPERVCTATRSSSSPRQTRSPSWAATASRAGP